MIILFKFLSFKKNKLGFILGLELGFLSSTLFLKINRYKEKTFCLFVTRSVKNQCVGNLFILKMKCIKYELTLLQAFASPREYEVQRYKLEFVLNILIFWDVLF